MSNEVQEIVKLHKITTNTPKIKISTISVMQSDFFPTMKSLTLQIKDIFGGKQRILETTRDVEASVVPRISERFASSINNKQLEWNKSTYNQQFKEIFGMSEQDILEINESTQNLLEEE